MLKRLTFTLAFLFVAGGAGVAQRGNPPAPTVPSTVERGMLRDGTTYTLARPNDNWNGTLLVSLDTANLSSGYATWLLSRGYALGGNDRTKIGSLMDQAAANLVETVDLFTAKFGAPKRSIVWGNSLGGQATAVTAFKYPNRFVGALSFCGGLMGWPAYLNTNLDVAFALRTLLAPLDAARGGPTGANLPLTRIPEDDAEINRQWRALLDEAQKTPQGRARIALAAALGQAPVWTNGMFPEPAADDVAARQEASYRTVLQFSVQFTALRRRLEAPAGGGTSWNSGVDYAKLLASADAGDRRTVETLYRQAGLSLTDDLASLARAPRVAPEKAATDFVWNLYPFDGSIRIPVLTLATTGDPFVWPTIDSQYEAKVRQAGKQDLLRMTYVHSAGHCAFSDAERVAMFQVLFERLDSGRWPQTSPEAMNARATASGLGAARFYAFKPPALYRTEQRP